MGIYKACIKQIMSKILKGSILGLFKGVVTGIRMCQWYICQGVELGSYLEWVLSRWLSSEVVHYWPCHIWAPKNCKVDACEIYTTIILKTHDSFATIRLHDKVQHGVMCTRSSNTKIVMREHYKTWTSTWIEWTYLFITIIPLNTLCRYNRGSMPNNVI